MNALPSVPEEMAASREPRVLVVDDEEHITELVAMGLGYNGFDVERASTGRAALDAIDRRKPDLIVLDVMLPDLDGFELTRRLRQSEGAGTRVPAPSFCRTRRVSSKPSRSGSMTSRTMRSGLRLSMASRAARPDAARSTSKPL